MHPIIASINTNIGQAYFNQDKYKEAIDYYFKALKIAKQVFGEMHPATANLYGGIGISYDKLGKYNESLSYLNKALKIFQVRLGNKNIHTKMVKNMIDTIKKK